MKNTKNLLITGVVLTTALFTSVQMNAFLYPNEYRPNGGAIMNPENPNLQETQTVNPHLHRIDKLQLWDVIYNYTTTKNRINNPADTKFIANAARRTNLNAQLHQRIDECKSAYYGNRAYSDDEIRNLMRPLQ